MAEWDAELEVDPDAVRVAAGSPRRWRLLASGWDCDAWLADESTVWRVPRRHVGSAALRREAALLPLLAPRLPAPVPVPTLLEREGLPVLARHALVPGAEFASASRAGPRFGAALGRFLRALHSPGIAAAAAGIVPRDPLGRADAAKRMAVAHRRLDDVETRIDVAPFRAIVDAAAGLTPPVEVLCHGDLHIRHVLLDDRGELAGVIDWGDSCIGACAMDLAFATALDPGTFAGFVGAYGDVSADTWRFARMLGVMFAASLLAADPEGESGRGAGRWLETMATSESG